MTTHVNFKQAKFLKEKGFNNIDCDGYYHVNNGYTKGYAFCYSNVKNQEDNAILAPTIAKAIMWLCKKRMKKFFNFSFALLIIYLNEESLIGFQLCTLHRDYSDRCLLGVIYDDWDSKFYIDILWFTFKI